MTVKLIGITQPTGGQTPGQLISYIARVSNPNNQENYDTALKLLKYCFEEKHWSIFEMVNLVFEVETTRDIGRQILRHKSFSFSEFSLRYAVAPEKWKARECRLQDNKDRQNSFKNDNKELEQWWYNTQIEVKELTKKLYQEAIDKGIAKEQSRVILPEGLTTTKLYMNGTLRSWIHYCQLRSGDHTQKEHRIIASEIKYLIKKEIPEISDIL